MIHFDGGFPSQPWLDSRFLAGVFSDPEALYQDRTSSERVFALKDEQ
jgi:hypothetical protein